MLLSFLIFNSMGIGFGFKMDYRQDLRLAQRQKLTHEQRLELKQRAAIKQKHQLQLKQLMDCSLRLRHEDFPDAVRGLEGMKVANGILKEKKFLAC